MEGCGSGSQRSSDDNRRGGGIERILKIKKKKNQYLIFLKIGIGIKFSSVVVQGLFIDECKETNSERGTTASSRLLKQRQGQVP